MSIFDVSNDDLVALFNKSDIEYVKWDEDRLIVQWKEKEDSIGGYFIVAIHNGLLFCQALWELVDNIADRNELLHTLISPSDFRFFNSWELDENNILAVNSALLVGYGVSEATAVIFMVMFFSALLKIEEKLEELEIGFNSIAEKLYDELFSES